MQFPSRDFTAQYISLSYQSVAQTYVQGTSSYLLDGTGTVIAFIPTSSIGQRIITDDQPVSFAITAAYAMNGGGNSSPSSSWASQSLSSSFSQHAAYSDLSGTSSLSITALFSDTASYSFESTFSDTASVSLYTNYAGSSSYALTSSVTLTATASYLSASVATASNVYVNNRLVMDNSYLELSPISSNPPNDALSTLLYVSASNNTDDGEDLYFNQSGSLVKFKWIVNRLSCGLSWGGYLSASGSNVYVSKGVGHLMNYHTAKTLSNNPIITRVTWNDITQSLTYISSSQTTFIYIDNQGNLQQQTTNFTPAQYSSSIPLGRIGHSNYTFATTTNPLVETVYGQSEQFSIFVRAFGPLKISGLALFPKSSSLQFGISSGDSFVYGGMYDQTPEFPSEVHTTAILTASIARVWRSGSGFFVDNNNGAFYNSIDPTNWDNGSGGLQSVGNTNWSVQRVFFNPISNRFIVYYGQETYNTFNNAINGFATDTFSESGQTFTSYVLIAYLVVQGNTTDLSDISANQILQAGVFRNIASAGGVVPMYALSDLTNVSTPSPAQNDLLMFSSSLWVNSHVINVSGSLVGTSSWSNNSATSLTSSYVTASNIVGTVTSSSYTTTASFSFLAASSSFNLNIQAGIVPSSSFGGTPNTASVLFNVPFSDTNYTITICGVDARSWAYESKTTSSFIINSKSSTALLGEVSWQVIKF